MYEFGPFRLDARKKTLARGSDPIILTPKVFETLLLLIENRERVLSKDDLMGRLWPDTFVDEANLSQNIFVLRKTLGETAQDQRYIVTVRGTGYRFAEEVREISGAPAVPAKGAFLARWTKLVLLGILSVLVMAALVAGILYGRRRGAARLTDQDTILVSDFENRTGDPVFDGTLKPALTIQLEQSPFLSLISDQKVQATLKLMDREDKRMGREVALEVCQRANGKAMIAGSIASLGKEYVILLQALDCRAGDAFAGEQARAEGKEEVLDALGKAVSGLRSQLGESLASIHKFDVPLREATTSSLQALKAFNSGAEIMRHNAEQSASIPLFTRAIELDPNFALAHVYLASAYGNIGENERAAESQKRAYALRDRVSEREKLFITSFYHYRVTGDIDKEVETYQLWMEEYPRDWIPLDSLAGDYLWYLGQHEKSAELYSRAWQLDPQQPFSPAGLASAYLALNRPEDARQVLDRARAAKLDNLPVRAALYQLAVMQGDTATAAAQVQWSASQPVQDNLEWQIASAAAQQGRLGAARMIVEKDAKELEAKGLNETAALEYSGLTLIESGLYQFNKAREHAASSLALYRGSNLQRVALALALAGEEKRSQALSDEMLRRNPHDAMLHRFVVPCLQAAAQIHRHQYAQAVALLEPVRRYDLGTALEFYSLYLRGLAYLGNKQVEAAAGEFERIVKNRGVAPVSPNWTLAHLGLARAYALSGDIPKARAAYQTFLALCQEADSDIPIVQAARTEYQGLR